MTRSYRQRGMSLISLIALVGVIGFAIVIGLKLVPIYLESWKIDKTINAVVKDPEVGAQEKQAIINSILKRLDIDGVKAVSYTNWRQSLSVTKRQNRVIIRVQYEEVVPLIGNLSLLAEFDKRAER